MGVTIRRRNQGDDMASVTPVKRSTGYAWRVQARNADGKMRQETFYGDDPEVTESAARSFGDLVDRVGITEASRIRDARTGAAARGVPTLAAWAETYLDKSTGYLAGVTDGTRQKYRRDIAQYITPQLGELPVDAIDADDVAQWVVWMEAQPSQRNKGQRLAAKTVKNKHALLSAMLAAAAKRGLRKGNPAMGAKLTRTRRRRMVFLTQSEFAVLLHFVDPRHRGVVAFLAGTGMRWGEVTALTWGDIDRDSRPMLVHIDKTWQQAEVGSGLRVLGPPKSDAGERTISVPDELVAELGKPGRGDELVFPNGVGRPLWSGSFWERVWLPAVAAANDDEACKRAGLTPIGKHPRIHDLRHTHASWLIAARRPLPYIQARLGHEKITTTVDTYGHLMPDAQQGDADAISLAMAGVLTQIAAEPRRIES